MHELMEYFVYRVDTIIRKKDWDVAQDRIFRDKGLSPVLILLQETSRQASWDPSDYRRWCSDQPTLVSKENTRLSCCLD